MRLLLSLPAAAAAVLSLWPSSASLGQTLSVGPNVNISHRGGNDDEGAIAINPTNTQNLFVACNLETGAGLFCGYSTNGGTTWTTRTMASGSDGLATACCDPSMAFDSFGNLYVCYINNAISAIIVARSTDGGVSFTQVASLAGSFDQPTITTGPGSVWVTYESSGGINARGAQVTGLGAMGAFGAAELAPSSSGGNFGDIAVGPAAGGGKVAVTYQSPSSGQGPSTIYMNVDPDGLGASVLAARTTVNTTNVGGFDFIPAQPNRSIDAEAGLAWDRTGGVHDGRLYLVYTEETAPENNDMDIMFRYSDNNGTTWTPPVRVNTDATTRSQFFPKIAIDQATGHIAIVWYDCRNDPANVRVELWGTASVDGGVSFLPNIKISQGSTNVTDDASGIDLGDYIGLTMHNDVFYPVWADDSNSTGNNPDGTTRLDLYTARVAIVMPVCPADCDGNHIIQPADIACFVNTWFASVQNGTLAGDFDGNGLVQPADIAVFVNAWFSALSNPCP